MGSINWARVLLGGLAAGILCNASGIALAHFFFQSEIASTMERLRLSFGVEVAILHVTMRLAMGVALVWLYAAIRPRFGPGPRTALVAGTAMFFFAYLWSLLGILPYQLFPERLLWIAAGWGLAEANACALLGAYLYKEPAG